uniref:Ferritin n=1 Tax=Oryza nivara TaxID=4536 RepID=A0A0E0J5U6_ORYNI
MLPPRVAPAAAAAAPTYLAAAASTPASVWLPVPRGAGAVAVCRAAGKGKEVLSGVVFQPFEELKGELSLVPQAKDQSLARQKFVDECEAAINEQIKFFKESSDEERDHAEKLMKYQNMRGGRVRLQSIVTPLTEFDHPEKGDALYAMELALALEKLVNEKLHNLHSVASRCNDPQLTDFVESEFLEEQVEAIKKISEYVAQLRRVGKGHGVWHFDQKLLEEEA